MSHSQVKALRAGEVTLSRVRPLRAGDEDEVLDMWGRNVGDHLKTLSYDRWGPGVPVPVRPSVPEVAAVVIDPRDGVIAVLRRFLTSPTAFCLVAQDAGPGLDGFVTGAVVESGLDDSCAGVVGELYVRPEARRRRLGTELVDAAIREFGRRGATMYKAEVPPDWAEGVAFWRRRRHWEQDALVFSRYD